MIFTAIVQAKKLALSIAPGAAVFAELHTACEFAVLKIVLPAGIDDFGFRDEFFTRLANECDEDSLARLAVRVCLRP